VSEAFVVKAISPTIGDGAVKSRTGKTWSQWFAILDKAGCTKMTHKEIVACLGDYAIGGWWQQMVSVTYEQARGLREKHQKADGYSASISRTLGVPVAELFTGWNNLRTRRRWLGEPLTIRKATANKSMRITWPDGTSSVEVNFYAKGPAKSQVTVQHNKLRSAKDVAKMKQYWAQALAQLAQVLL
jgi:hypothetical protein